MSVIMESEIQMEMPPTASRRPMHTHTTYKRSTKKAPPPPPRMPPRSLSVGDDCAIDERLEGSVDLRVILPDCSVVELTVDRRTALLDLLVQVTASHKISPGSHLLYTQPTVPALDSTGTLALYPPNTPVGSLDATTLYVLPKQQQMEAAIPRPGGRTVPFEPSVRLTVNLPRRQRAVLRLSPTATLADVKIRICQNYTLDQASHKLVDPRRPGSHLLDLNTSLAEFGHTEINLVSLSEMNQSSQEFLPPPYSIKGGKGSRSTSGILDYFKKGIKKHSSRQDGSVERRASEEKESRASSLPPSRKTSFNHSDITSTARSGKKKAPPPPPPPLSSSPISTPSPPPILPATEALSSSPPPKTHSRNNSDTSSGYHEASVLSDSPENSSGGSGPIESPTPSESVVVASVPRPLSQSPPSLSSSCTSVGGTKKRKAPPPPIKAPSLSEDGPSSSTKQNSDNSSNSKSDLAEPPQPSSEKSNDGPVSGELCSSPKIVEKEIEKQSDKEATEDTFPLPVQRCSSLPDLVEMSPEVEEEVKEVAENEVPPNEEAVNSLPSSDNLVDKLTAEVETAAPWEEDIPAPPSPFRSTFDEESASPPLPETTPPLSPSSLEKEDEISSDKPQVTCPQDIPSIESTVVVDSGEETIDTGCETILTIMPRHRQLENFSIGTYKKPEEDIFASSSTDSSSIRLNDSTSVNQNDEINPQVNERTSALETSNLNSQGTTKDKEKVAEPLVATNHYNSFSIASKKESVSTKSIPSPSERNSRVEKSEEKSKGPSKSTGFSSSKSEDIVESHVSLPEGQDWQEQLRQFKELERQYHAWKEQLARNQLLLEENVVDERCQTLPRPPRPTSLLIEGKGNSATLGRRPPRPKSQAIVTIGSWEKRTQKIKVVDNDIVSSAKQPDDVDSRKKHFAGNVNGSEFKKPKPPPPPKKSQSLETLSSSGSSTPTENKSLPPSKQFFLLQKTIKDEARQPSATSSKYDHSQAQAKTSPVVPNHNSSLEEIRVESRYPIGSMPKVAPRKQCGMNGDAATPTESTHRSISDNKAALMEELKKRITPPPASENRSFTLPPQSKSSIRLDPRAELMLEIRNFAGKQALRPVSASNGCP